jgi:hypothetical protein
VPLESYRIDRKALLNSVAILEVVLSGCGDNLEFRVRGEGENASIRISTPGTPLTHSSDEVPIIRSGPSLASHHEGPSRPPGERPAETLFWANGRQLREVLSGLGAVTLACHFDHRNRRLILEEVPLESDPVLSVLLSVLIPRPDEQ